MGRNKTGCYQVIRCSLLRKMLRQEVIERAVDVAPKTQEAQGPTWPRGKLLSDLDWNLDVLTKEKALAAGIFADVVQCVGVQAYLAARSRGHLRFKVRRCCA